MVLVPHVMCFAELVAAPVCVCVREHIWGVCPRSCAGSHSCVSVGSCGPGAVLLAAPCAGAVLVAASLRASAHSAVLVAARVRCVWRMAVLVAAVVCFVPCASPPAPIESRGWSWVCTCLPCGSWPRVLAASLVSLCERWMTQNSWWSS